MAVRDRHAKKPATAAATTSATGTTTRQRRRDVGDCGAASSGRSTEGGGPTGVAETDASAPGTSRGDAAGAAAAAASSPNTVRLTSGVSPGSLRASTGAIN